MIIYQIFTRIFGNRNTTRKEWGTVAENGCGKMADIDARVLRRIHDMGVTHVWYTGVVRHATQTDYTAKGIPAQHAEIVKGRAGSPYAITDYYDVDPDLAVDVANRMEEWEQLIARTHAAGMKVIMDFVPNHVAREYHSICRPAGARDLGEGDDTGMNFSVHNNFYYCCGQALDLSRVTPNQTYQERPARATGNDHFDQRPGPNDWYETIKLNYGVDYCDAGGRSEHFDPVPDTWVQMRDILLFWAAKGIDGFRCDMAEMVPAPFWAYATAAVRAAHPSVIFVGEVYNPDLYRTYIDAGFDYLYDKVGMYDSMRDIICGHRWASDITTQWQRTDDIRTHMLYFLENHDEQRIASDYFAANPWRAFPAHMVCCLLQTNPYMLYAGQELGERGMDREGFSGWDGRTSIFDYWSVDSIRHGYFDLAKKTPEERQLMAAYRQVMRIAGREKAVTDGAMFDLMYVNTHFAEEQFAFIRKAGREMLLVAVNFSDLSVCREVTIPAHAFDFLNILAGTFTATELLTGVAKDFTLTPDGSIPVDIPDYGGVIYKFKF